MVQTSELLNIQKFIYLLDEFHFAQFTEYLKEINALLPLKLSQLIRKKMPAVDTHEELCKKAYGNYRKNERLNFNQLASYTFKLSSSMAINYPAYLAPNYRLIQQHINEGDIEKANFIARLLLDVSEKTEDHATQIFVLKFLIQQAFLMKESTVGIRLTHQLEEVYKAEKICHEILSDLRLRLNVAVEASINPAKLKEYQTKFKSYHQHPSAAVRLLSKYASIYTLYYFESERFKDGETKAMIEDSEKELNNYSFVVFPFAFDLKSNFSFYKLNHPLTNLTDKKGKKEFDDLKKHYNAVKFWNSYLNIPEIFAMALKASEHLTAYHHYVHRADYNKTVSDEDLKEIKLLAGKCREMLTHKDLDAYYKNDLINLKLLYSGLLILSGGAGIKQGAEELETMLITYQQISLAGTSDSVFLFLIIAYFAMRKYDKCAATFKRYIRTTKGKPVYEDNDIEIHVYYYLSQWLLLRSNQYLVKLKAKYEQAVKNGIPAEQLNAIAELIQYFEIPVEV